MINTEIFDMTDSTDERVNLTTTRPNKASSCGKTSDMIRGEESLAAVMAAANKKRVDVHHFGEGSCRWTIEATQGAMADSKHTDMLIEELKLPQMPEMVFLNNTVSVKFNNEVKINFNARDALAKVSLTPDDNIKVAATEKWREARKDSEYIDRETLRFDWTFTTEYFGSLFNIFPEKIRDPKPTHEFINVEKLTKRDPILFFQNLILFEDELSDNGCAQLNVKLRAMKNCFLLLLRFYLRVDDVLVRVIDSRFYTEPTWSVIIWEFSKRENTVSELREKDISYNQITDANEIPHHMTVVHETTKVIELN